MFKEASVTPVIKKAGLDEDTPSYYRSISNLNNISKLLERLFLSLLQPQIIWSPNFNHHQSAYRLYHSTDAALFLTLNSIYKPADNKNPQYVSLLISVLPVTQ
jgi:hypothetical protein